MKKYCSINIEKSSYPLVISILVLIGCQQFPVLNISGSSLKIYEICSMLILIKYWPRLNNIYTQITFLLFFLIPTISLFFAYLLNEYPTSFFIYYSSQKEDLQAFRFNYYFFPFLQLIYMWINFAAISAILFTRLYT